MIFSTQPLQKSPIHIISFGSDMKYQRLSKRLLSKLKIIYPNANTYVFTPKELPIKIRNYATTYPRGYGYWSWKPFLVLKMLNRVEEDDVLLYIDGRTGAPIDRRIDWFDQFLSDNEYLIAAWQMNHKEYAWTSGDLFYEFSLEQNSKEAESGQYAATFFALRNTKQIRQLVKRWYEVVWYKSHLCRDEKSLKKCHPDYVENRHDQSVFSLLVKWQFRQSSRTLLTVLDHQIYSPSSIQPQRKPHPDTFWTLETLLTYGKVFLKEHTNSFLWNLLREIKKKLIKFLFSRRA